MSMTPISEPEFGVKAELPAISFSYDKLVAEAKAMTAKYENLVITEDQVKEIKKDMAELNAAKNRLDKARKDVVRQITEPVKRFEAQIKEVCAIFDQTYKYLQDQVQVFVQKERDEKQDAVKSIIIEELEASKERIEPFEIPIQESWLNKTTSMKAVREAIKAIIEAKIESEAAQAALKRAQVDRVAAIEQIVKSVNAEFGVTISIAHCMGQRYLSLETPLEEISAAIRDMAECLAQQKATQPQESGAKVEALSEPEPVSETEDAGEPIEEKNMSIILSFPITKEADVKSLLAQLKGLCTTFAMRKK